MTAAFDAGVFFWLNHLFFNDIKQDTRFFGTFFVEDREGRPIIIDRGAGASSFTHGHRDTEITKVCC